MEPKLLGRRRRATDWLIWPMRLLVLVGCYLLTVKVIYPGFGFPVNVIVGGLVAAAAIAGEVCVSAWLRRQKPVDVAKWRMLMLDHLLAGEKSLTRQPQPQRDSVNSQPPVAFGELPRPAGEDVDFDESSEAIEGQAWDVDGDAVEDDR